METHLGDVCNILEKLKQAGIFFKLKKCEWFKESVPYLGHIIK